MEMNMARLPGGTEYLAQAQDLLKKAKTVEELRTAQAVALPLLFNLSIEQTAQIIGRSVGATCTLRTNFCREQAGEARPKRSKRELRNRAKASLEQEAKILDEALTEAATGGVVIVPPLKPVIEAKLGKPLALSTIYAMLARHGWRKVAPDKIHPKSDPDAQEDWKKNCMGAWQKKEPDFP